MEEIKVIYTELKGFPDQHSSLALYGSRKEAQRQARDLEAMAYIHRWDTVLGEMSPHTGQHLTGT